MEEEKHYRDARNLSTRLVPFIVFMILFCIQPQVGAAKQQQSVPSKKCSSDTIKHAKSTILTKQFGNYQLQQTSIFSSQLRTNRTVSYKLKLHGKVVFSESLPGPEMTFDECEYYFKYLGDINKDGVPELSISRRLDGTGGGVVCKIVELGRLRPRIILNEVNGSWELKDLNHDGIFEIATFDGSYESWNSNHIYSFHPQIVFGWTGRSYAPSAKYMRQARISDVELAKWVDEDRKDAISEVHGVFESMIALIYRGDAEQARKFLDLVFPDNSKTFTCEDANYKRRTGVTKQELWNILITKIKQSPYLPVLKELNPALFTTKSVLNPACS